MDATALYAYRYQNMYMVYMDLYDGYPSGRGSSLVRSIPTDPEEFNNWLTKTRASNLRIIDTLRYTDASGCYRRPSCSAPRIDTNFRWVYVIDLDRLVFSVGGTAHFKLNNIPRGEGGQEWIRYLGQDGVGWRCVKPLTPREYVADVELYPSVSIPEMGGVRGDGGEQVDWFRCYDSLGAMLVDPLDLLKDCSQTEIASQSTAVTIVKAIVGHYYGRLCDACQYEPSDWRFQRAAAYLLRASAPNFLQLHLASDLTRGCSSQEYDPEVDKEGPEKDYSGHEPGVFFWFRGRLILLATRLEFEADLTSSVARVVTRLRSKNKSTRFCTALIWSIRHVVVVRVSNDHVVHTPALAVLPAFEADEVAFAMSVCLMARVLRPFGSEDLRFCYGITLAEGAGVLGSSSSSSESSVGVEPSDLLVPAETLSSSNRISLPTDVILEIMKYVDVRMYDTTFSRLNWATRMAWMNRPRIGPYAVYGVVTASSSSLRTESTSNPFNYLTLISNSNSLSLNCPYCTSPSPSSSSSSSSSTPNNNSPPLLVAHTETGFSVLLRMVYEGHPYLGNSTLSSLATNPYVGAKRAVRRVVLLWPSSSSLSSSFSDLGLNLDERRGRGGGKGGGRTQENAWDEELERCGLVLLFA